MFVPLHARRLSAFQIVMADALRREQEEAAAAAAAADPKAAKEQPPPTPAPKIDPKAHGYLMTDLVTAFEQIKASGLATLDDNGELGVDFKGFRAMLARHAGALEGIDAGGKKGKKGVRTPPRLEHARAVAACLPALTFADCPESRRISHRRVAVVVCVQKKKK